MVKAETWIERFCAVVETEAPSEMEINAILKLAGVAAHSSERIAAPVACWVAGRAGIDLAEAIRIAETIGTDDREPGGGEGD